MQPYVVFFREAGVGFANSPPQIPAHDFIRTELLKLLLTCFSEAIYLPPHGKYTHSIFCIAFSCALSKGVIW